MSFNLGKERLARHQLLCDDAEEAEHSEAAVVELLGPHGDEAVLVVRAEPTYGRGSYGVGGGRCRWRVRRLELHVSVV